MRFGAAGWTSGLSRVGLCALVVALAFGFAGCGGGKKADANDWVADVCKGAATLRDARANALLKFFEVDADNGPGMYDGFNTYSKTYGEALDRFDKTVAGAGEPDVKDSSKVRSALRAWIAAERKSNTDAAGKVSKLDRSSDTLATQVGDIFFAIQFADLRALLVESKAASADQIEALIQRDAICAFELFAQEE